MEKSKLNIVIILGLILLNFCTLGYVFLRSPKHDRSPMEKNGPKGIIIKKLHFDENQQKEFAKLIEWHQREIQKLDKEIMQSKNALYTLLGNKEIDINIKDSLINALNLNQKLIEETHFKHFEDIKKLCKADQLEEFNEFSKELGGIFKNNKQPRGLRGPNGPNDHPEGPRPQNE